MAEEINIHELAALPFAGAAQAALEKSGKWDEHAGLPVKEYRVRVDYEIRSQEVDFVTVKARTEEEAEDLAYQKVERDCEYSVEFDSAEVL